MSFRINTNVTALNALRNVNNSQELVSQSITRLSTGFRINSAADDPAGLIASAKFDAQVNGLNQAIQNSQDGINFAKTAEGALSEVSNLLNDARNLAVQAANTGTISSSQLQANQLQIQSIISSINRISTNTQFGTKKLLDGSSGIQSTVTDLSKVASLNIGGTFNGTTLAANGSVVLTVTTAAAQATLVSKALATSGTLVGAGSITINGVTITTGAADTAATLVNAINAVQGQTGVGAFYDSANTRIQLTSNNYGSKQTINLVDSSAVFKGAAGFYTASGVDAVATVGIGATSVTFTGSKNGTDGLTLTDSDGNTLRLTSAGNATTVTNATVGQVTVGSAQFQVGANSGQTVNLSLSNYAASNLGTGVAAGANLTTIDLTTSAGASQAIQIIDSAIDQISTARGSIGNFQRNVLESTVRSLGVASENLSATESDIRDTDVAAETTQLTKKQIILQAGISVLAQANTGPQQVLSLLPR
ncbi:MAG: hypothetical protein JSS72_13235 [Armatimonadetes bacterium]|nr:hypothetical protein [Armatimonadota bacterium]